MTWRELAESLGFQFQDTGGNCTAYVKETQEGIFYLTKIEDPEIPTEKDTSARLGFYHNTFARLDDSVTVTKETLARELL